MDEASARVSRHPVCRSASPSTMAAAVTTLSERRPGRSGTRTAQSTLS